MIDYEIECFCLIGFINSQRGAGEQLLSFACSSLCFASDAHVNIFQ